MSGLRIALLETDEELRRVFGLMAQLRDRVRAETFVSEVRAQQGGGYRLAIGWIGEKAVVAAGYREAQTLSRGKHLFVDDLVTDKEERGKGYGREMLRW